MPALSRFMLFAFLLLSAAAGSAQTSSQAPYTLTTNVRRVITDVSVVDGNGRPVRGLKQGDFQIFEDNKPQAIRGFDEQLEGSIKPIAALPHGVYTDIVDAQLPGTVNVLLIDAYDTDVINQMYLRLQLQRAIAGFGGRSAVAVFGVNSGHAALMLQSFTTDPALLRAAVDRELPRLLQNGGGYIEHFDDSVAALASLSTYLSRVPGHKNLLWFTSDFPLTDPSFGSGNPDREESQAALTHLYNQLSLDRVAVYPIDVKGPDVSSGGPGVGVGQPQSGEIEGSGGRPGNNGSVRGEAQGRNITGEVAMDKVAAFTGGEAFYERNDIAHVVQKAVDDGSDYYTLTYSPNPYLADNRFHRIRVAVAGGQYTLHYRSGYVAFDSLHDDASGVLDDTKLKEINGNLDTIAAGRALARTKTRESDADQLTDYSLPQGRANTILFEARIVPAADVAGWQVLPPARDRKGRIIGSPHDQPFVIEYAALSKDLCFAPTPAGKQHAELIAAAMAYTETGEVVGTAIDRVQLNYTPEQLLLSQRIGTPLRQQIRLPRGSVYVSLSLIDNTTGHTGTLELPYTASAKR